MPSEATKMLGSIAPPWLVGQMKAALESSTKGPDGLELVAREMHMAVFGPCVVSTHPGAVSLVDAVEGLRRRRRVVHDERAVGAAPDRRRPLVSRHGPRGQRREGVAQVVAGEARGAGDGDDGDVRRRCEGRRVVLVA